MTEFAPSFQQLPLPLRHLILSFLLALLFGYASSFILLETRTSLSPTGIEKEYLGNEENQTEGEPIKFRKSKAEMLTTIHTHVFTLSIVFLAIGSLIYFTPLKNSFKLLLMTEPLLSLILTFGSLELMWLGFPFFNYIALASGILMHTVFLFSIGVLIFYLYRTPYKEKK